ncbi:MAG: hypothetical protein L0332_27275 [Chloroflexi bacterium]|nr:hypothetical protein [Chloroflexota bacterium]MCI0578809.1 hypothetical protein [Chloroflexota bacterium]MCI0644703.1 hypothetical protein [Chloroflexota bacterium]MCI0730401.1 hypothetical protein [Chloroflexota bacterium]
MFDEIQNLDEREAFASKIQNLEIGRVLRASTAGFAVGCRVHQLAAPSFGCLVKAQPVDAREAIYGLVYDIHIDDDPLVRRLVLAENPRQSVIEDQRNNRLLPIEMSTLAVGYRLNGELHHGLPPRPPLNLDPVFLCDEPDEVREFTARPGYLRLILRTAGSPVPVDQLLVAHIGHTYQQRGRDAAWAMRTIEELIELLRSNYDLLVPTLEAISDALPELEIGG